MKVIVLAAGQGYQLDGFNKLLLRNPHTNERIIESYLRLFNRDNLTFVVGYRAINVIHNYPNLNYIYNEYWATFNNSLSLYLAIDNNPTIVISGDLFLKDSILDKIYSKDDNLVITQNNELRSINSLNVSCNDSFRIKSIYQGKIKNIKDYEAMGIYKITDKNLLKSWKNNCLNNKDKLIGQNLDFENYEVISVVADNDEIKEINCTDDYLRFKDL